MTDKQHKNIFVALAHAQTEMGPVIKGAENPHFKSKYADLADVLNVALPALNKNGIAYFATIEGAGAERVMRTTLMHGESDTSVHCDVPLLVAKGDMQGMKSATTYAKRIGIESLGGIAPEDDDGNAATKGAEAFRREQEQERAAESVKARQISIDRLTQAPDLKALQTVWTSLPAEQKADQVVLDAKNDMKAAMDVEKEAGESGLEKELDDKIPY